MKNNPSIAAEMKANTWIQIKWLLVEATVSFFALFERNLFESIISIVVLFCFVLFLLNIQLLEHRLLLFLVTNKPRGDSQLSKQITMRSRLCLVWST